MLCRLSDWRKKHFYRGQTDRPRVLHVITGLHVGGAENFLYRLLSTFDHECLKHAVACFKWGPVAQKIGALGVPVHQVSRVFYRNDYLGEFVKNWKPDVIHASEWTANVLARSLKKDQPKIPIVCALHSNPDYHGFIRNFFERWMPLPDKFVAVSRGVVEGYERNIVAHLGNDAAKSFRDRLKVIENGINIDYYAQPSGGAVSLRRELGIPPHAFVVGAVGRMVPIKAYDHLIDSFSFFLKSVNGNAHLVFVGEGPERARLESYVENLGLGAWVHFVGLQRDLLQWYAMFDALGISSRGEGLSMALLEALSSGIPIVTTKTGDGHEVIEDRKNGLLTEVGDTAEFSEALGRLYRGGKSLRREYAAVNIELLRSRFDIECCAQRYQELYASLLDRVPVVQTRDQFIG